MIVSYAFFMVLEESLFENSDYCTILNLRKNNVWWDTKRVVNSVWCPTKHLQPNKKMKLYSSLLKIIK
jgi:hypothetical protein